MEGLCQLVTWGQRPEFSEVQNVAERMAYDDDAQASFERSTVRNGPTMKNNGLEKSWPWGPGELLCQAQLPSRDLSKQSHSESLSHTPRSWQGTRALG